MGRGDINARIPRLVGARGRDGVACILCCASADARLPVCQRERVASLLSMTAREAQPGSCQESPHHSPAVQRIVCIASIVASLI